MVSWILFKHFCYYRYHIRKYACGCLMTYWGRPWAIAVNTRTAAEWKDNDCTVRWQLLLDFYRFWELIITISLIQLVVHVFLFLVYYLFSRPNVIHCRQWKYDPDRVVRSTYWDFHVDGAYISLSLWSVDNWQQLKVGVAFLRSFLLFYTALGAISLECRNLFT